MKINAKSDLRDVISWYHPHLFMLYDGRKVILTTSHSDDNASNSQLNTLNTWLMKMM